MTRRFAAAVSEHPLPTHAIGEVIGEVAEQLGEAPEAAVLFVTAPLVGVLEDYVTAVRELLSPTVLVGASAVTVMAGRREAEEIPAVALWAGRFATPPRVVRISAERTPMGIALEGFAPEPGEENGTLMLLADPFTFPVDGFLQHLADTHPEVSVCGGLASAARGPGGNRLVALDQQTQGTAIHSSGAVGLVFPDSTAISFAVSQGCRPIGQPFTVTGADRNRLQTLAGRPAVEHLQELLANASPEDRLLIQQGLHIGVVHDHRGLDFARGDFLIRAVMNADAATGEVTVGDLVPVGATVQFQVRDGASASEDLHAILTNRRAESALTFSCNGRGSHLFGQSNHDADMIAELLDDPPMAGMFCAGEIGPVGGRNQTHGFTASMLLFH